MKRLVYALLAVAVSLGLGMPQINAVQAAVLPCSASPGHVTVVVQHQDNGGAIVQRCVGIGGTSASAEVVLSNSGLESANASTTGGLGDELCKVDNEPSTFPSPCLLPGQPYWAMFVSKNGAPWYVSPQGISTLVLNNGDALGLRFDGANSESKPPMPTITCPQPTSATSASSVRSGSGGGVTSSGRATSSQKKPAAGSSAGAGTTATNQPALAHPPTGAVLALHTTAAPQSPATTPISWLILFSCMVGGGLLGLMTVRVVRR